MANFLQMQNDLALLGMANLLNTDFGALLNKVHREEIESWNWSFLYQNVVLNSIAPINTGTATVTQNATNISFSGAPALSTAQNGWWIRLGATLTTPVQVLQGALSSVSLTKPWAAPSVTNQPYSLFPLYYDVFPLIEVTNVKQIDFLTQTSQETLNRIDPSRVSTGGAPALRWAQAPWNLPSVNTQFGFAPGTAGHFNIELWPVPSSSLPYIVWGKIGPVDMTNTTDLPMIPSSILEAKAMMYACRALFASSGNPKWMTMADGYKADYQYELDQARSADNRRKVTLGITSGGIRSGNNLGEDYYATHDQAGPPYVGY